MKHGVASYQAGCRCGVCRRGQAEAQDRWRDGRKAALDAGELNVTHGKVSTYVNCRCRCAECKQAMSDYQRGRREALAAKLAADPTIRPHGTETTYNLYGCRCDECKAVMAEVHDIRQTRRFAERH